MPRVLYIHTQALRAETPHARRTFEMLTLMRRAGLSVDVLTLPRGDAWPKGLADHVYRTLPVPFARRRCFCGEGTNELTRLPHWGQ